MNKDERIKVYEQMADYFRKHGFAYGLGEKGGPRCFIGAKYQIRGGDSFSIRDSPFDELVGEFDAISLRLNGWNTDDAIAACEIAAAIAEVA